MAADQAGVTLIVRRRIQAAPARVYEAWTAPQHVVRWWGPRSVTCVGAEIDLRVAGRYRIGNLFPDGKVLWIAGAFEAIVPGRKLVFTWGIEPDAAPSERVTVHFDPCSEGTDVVVIHERIATAALRDGHDAGWQGCLDGLVAYLAA
jgi:uncharacterized protein YndB with AHSA1/START domain